MKVHCKYHDKIVTKNFLLGGTGFLGGGGGGAYETQHSTNYSVHPEGGEESRVHLDLKK